MRVDVYSRHDAYLGTIGAGQLIEFTHSDELNGEDSVSITTTFRLREGYRLVWRDLRGRCHEHVCQDPKALHESPSVLYSDTALNSVCELFGDYVEDKRPGGQSYLRALRAALGPTRWEAGAVDQAGAVPSGLTFYHTSAREAIQSILECGGELETEVEVGAGGVASRRVGIRAHRGTVGGHRRFSYGKDVASVSKTEHWGAITACYGYGKGLETDAGGYGRKLTFGDVNGGLDYVADEDALAAYGRPDGQGGMAHVFGVFEDSECEDAATLLAETRAYLDEHKVPGVTYEAEVADLVQFGRDWEGVGVGDDVQLVDAEFSPPLRCEGRVTKLVTDLLGGTQEVTLGNVTETMADMWAQQKAELASLSKRASSWDVAAHTPGAYLQQIIDGLNEQFNVAGMSYCFTSFEQGSIWASVPLDSDGRPTEAGGSAIQVCSQGFRIASGTKADGSWDWRTFGTGEGFTADVITAGVIKGGSSYWNLATGDLLFGQGMISDVWGDNFWNLSTGEFKLGQKAIEDNGLAAADEALKSVDVEYAVGDSSEVAPTSGWQTDSPQWESGRYVWSRTKAEAADGTVSYSEPACIQGAAGPAGRDGVDGLPGRDGRDGADGQDGADGAPGADGKDGASSYVHIKYADVESPTDDQMTEVPSAYIGICVDSNPQDPDAAASYAWSRWAGRDGEDGIPGTPGADGTSSYVHFAYASSADGTQGFSVTPFEGATHVGVRTDSELADSRDPADYEWSLFKGADGEDGQDGAPGADGVGVSDIAEQYYLSTSEEACEGGSWSGEQPAWEKGKWIWTRSVVTWTDGTVTATEPVLARALTQAQQDVADLDESLDSEGVFNRLTDDGALQGLYMEGGKLYVNASYVKSGQLSADLIKAGTLKSSNGKFSLDLSTGRVTISSGTIDGEDVGDISDLLSYFDFTADGLLVGKGGYKSLYGSGGWYVSDSTGAKALQVYVSGSRVYMSPARSVPLQIQSNGGEAALIVKSDGLEYSAAPGRPLTRTGQYVGTGSYHAWHRLYYNPSGNTGTVTLSYSADKFILVMILYKDSNDNQHSTFAYKGGTGNTISTSATWAELCASYINSGGAWACSRTVTVQGTSISTYNNGGYYHGHTWTAIGGTSYGAAISTSDVAIIGVWGLQT